MSSVSGAAAVSPLEGTIPVWFGPEQSPLFGIINTSTRAQAARGAVILCPSLGREHMSAYPAFSELAARLAAVGVLTLRFDYRSTGDSFDRTEPSDGIGLLDDLGYAVDYVHSLGVSAVGLVGMRIGGLLAGLASALEPFNGVVLWDPCTSGRSFVREQRMLSLRIPVAGRPEPTDEIPGFHLPPDLLREISSLELDETTAALADRALLLTRGDLPPDRPLLGPLVGTNVEQRTILGQADLLYMPTPLQVVPTATIDMIANWLDGVFPRECQSVTLPAASEVVVGIEEAPAGETTAEGRAVAPSFIVERAIRLGENGLFGISTEPKDGAEGPVCLFINVANEHRIGPGRLWVDLARRLAPSGLRCVRIDLGGFGDSPNHDPNPLDVYNYSAIYDLVDAATSLSPEDPSNVVFFGLCSSGYHALEAASIISPRGVCALNPAVSFPAPETASGGPPDRRRRFFLPEAAIARGASRFRFHKVEQRIPLIRWAGGRFPLAVARARRLARSTLDHLGRPFRIMAWTSGTRPGHARSGPGDHLTDLVASGSNVFVICGPEEMRPFRHAIERFRGSSRRTGSLRAEVIPALDHALRRPRDRDEVSMLILGYVRETFLR